MDSLTPTGLNRVLFHVLKLIIQQQHKSWTTLPVQGNVTVRNMIDRWSVEILFCYFPIVTKLVKKYIFTYFLSHIFFPPIISSNVLSFISFIHQKVFQPYNYWLCSMKISNCKVELCKHIYWQIDVPAGCEFLIQRTKFVDTRSSKGNSQ